MPITPIGAATRRMRKPFGRVQSASVRASGSGRSATVSRPCAIASTRAGVSSSRSRNAAVPPAASNAAMSRALAATIGSAWRRNEAAPARSAVSRAGAGIRPSADEAARAAAAAARSQSVALAGSMCMALSGRHVAGGGPRGEGRSDTCPARRTDGRIAAWRTWRRRHGAIGTAGRAAGDAGAARHR